jgi:hypothetical protein
VFLYGFIHMQTLVIYLAGGSFVFEKRTNFRESQIIL